MVDFRGSTEAIWRHRLREASALLVRMRPLLRAAGVLDAERIHRLYQTMGATTLYGAGSRISAALARELEVAEMVWLRSVVVVAVVTTRVRCPCTVAADRPPSRSAALTDSRGRFSNGGVGRSHMGGTATRTPRLRESWGDRRWWRTVLAPRPRLGQWFAECRGRSLRARRLAPSPPRLAEDALFALLDPSWPDAAADRQAWRARRMPSCGRRPLSGTRRRRVCATPADNASKCHISPFLHARSRRSPSPGALFDATYASAGKDACVPSA